MSADQPQRRERYVGRFYEPSADRPLTGDELATIKARAEVIEAGNLRAVSTRVLADDVVRLVAEIERLQATVARVEKLASRLAGADTDDATKEAWYSWAARSIRAALRNP